MAVIVDETQAQAKSRLVGIRLTLLTLRLIENWRRYVRDYDSAMIALAVVAINSEKLTRTTLEPELEDLRLPMPAELLTDCNISSIASATGLNRETTRRKVNKMTSAGVLVRRDDGSIALSDGFTQGKRTLEVVRDQLETLNRTLNDLIRDGSLALATGTAPVRPRSDSHGAD